MRKQVTFVEGNKEQHLIRDGNSRLSATRSAGHYCAHRRKQIASDSLSSDETCGVKAQRTVPFKPNPKPTSEIQQLTTIHIPKSMMAAPFLQHPSLTPGQKQYLYSIANVYSTVHMRTLMKQHYLNVLHRCISKGRNQFGENTNTRASTQDKPKQFEPDCRREPKPNKYKTVAHSGGVTLPKIGNRENRTASGVSASNKRKGRKGKMQACTQGGELRTYISVGRNDDELLHKNINSLSIKDDEEILKNT